MNKRRLLKPGYIFTLMIVSLGLLFFVRRQLPQADVNIKNVDVVPAKTTTTVWGKVTYAENNQPAATIKLTIGNVSQTVRPDGTYAISLFDEGDVEVSFKDRNGQAYEIVDNMHQDVFIVRGDNLQADFVIEKIPQ